MILVLERWSKFLNQATKLTMETAVNEFHDTLLYM